MNDETLLVAFKAICSFINDLANEYEKKHKPLLLYKRLINKTKIAHDNAIKKHIMAFNAFCWFCFSILTQMPPEIQSQAIITVGFMDWCKEPV